MTRHHTQDLIETHSVGQSGNLAVGELREQVLYPGARQAEKSHSILHSRTKSSENELGSTEHFKKDGTTCIYTDLLIPGRGDPIQNSAAILEKGKIVFVGSQDDIPKKYSTTPKVKVPVLMPGLWDCHTHFSGTGVGLLDFITPSLATCGARIARSFHDTLMAGFTTVRDVGSFALEASKAVEEGLILGPNVYSAGAAISQTAGHGDVFELPIGWVWRTVGVSVKAAGDNVGSSMLCLADGVDECRKAIRLQIRRGAKLIKVFASGGVLSRDDDPKLQQFSDEELKVIVDEAGRMNRIVAAHVHGKDGIMAALRAGCRIIEHGTYLDDEAIEVMKEKGVMLVATRTIVVEMSNHADLLGPEQRAKLIQISGVHKLMYEHAVKSGVKCALGTDLGSSMLDEPLTHGRNGGELAYAVEAGMSPLEAIEAATANGPDTLGPMAPKSGQIKVGYDADVIALTGNPLEDINLFREVKNITHVWKAGKLSKGPGVYFGLVS